MKRLLRLKPCYWQGQQASVRPCWSMRSVTRRGPLCLTSHLWTQQESTQAKVAWPWCFMLYLRSDLFQMVYCSKYLIFRTFGTLAGKSKKMHHLNYYISIFVLFSIFTQVARLLQPSVILIEDAEKMFYKKVPKEEKEVHQGSIIIFLYSYFILLFFLLSVEPAGSKETEERFVQVPEVAQRRRPRSDCGNDHRPCKCWHEGTV